MSRHTSFVMCLLIWVALPSTESAASIQWWTLEQLVHEAPTIVGGTISIQDGEPVLRVQRTLKGESHTQLVVRHRPWLDIPVPSFQDGEVVLLFLETPEASGTVYLWGYGDQSKWPRTYDPNKPFGRRYPKIQATASVQDLEDVVAKLVTIEDTPQLDKKAELCAEYIRSSNRLLQFTAMRYARLDLFWAPRFGEPHPRISHETAKKRFGVIRNLAHEALLLSLPDSNDPWVRAGSIHLLRYAWPGDAMPMLIRRITDPDARVRKAVSMVLRTMAMELKIKQEPFVDYEFKEPPERLRLVQLEWESWLEANKHRLRTKKAQEKSNQE